ncbi:MAG: septum formation initiator family protein [Oscillospiraceae bacterium]|nr:septum formation initiator family protein [Oscillospiraceae bacterium]
MRDRTVIVRIVALALLLYALASLAAVRRELAAMEETRERMEGELAALRQEQALLDGALAACGEEASLRRLAWERLGMVMPGETVFYFTDGTD